MSLLWDRLTDYWWTSIAAKAPSLITWLPQAARLDAVLRRRFVSAFEHAVVGIALVTPDNRSIRANQALCDFLGYTEGELLRRSVPEIVHPDDLVEDRRQRALLLAGAKPSYRREKRYMHQRGYIVWGDASCRLVRDRRGRPLHFIIQIQDITERKHAERLLHEMQAMLHMAAQVGRLGGWAYDVSSNTVAWSEEVCAIHEVRQGFCPTPEQAFAFVAPEYRQKMHATFQACLRDGSPFDVEAEILTAKGHRVWVRLLCEAQWDAHARVQRLQGAMQDISEIKRAQHEIMRLNSELEERVLHRTEQLEVANRELEAFSYSIAHDLRAPLSSIDGFSKVLEERLGGALDDTSGRYLRRIRAGVQQMTDLSDGLLALTKMSHEELDSHSFDLAPLAHAALASCREGAPDRHVQVHVQQPMPAAGDPRLLARVLSNLIGNAWKFTGRQAKARIEVGCMHGPGGQLAYFVRDNGAGFDMAHASRMFRAFERLHTAAEFEGTGIGLAIVHKVVNRHGGQIWAESEPGRGATFYFTLNAPAVPRLCVALGHP